MGRKCQAKGGAASCSDLRCPEKQAERTRLSKNMSYVLRHNPGSINLTVDEEGWADLNQLADKLNTTVRNLKTVTKMDSKQRFTIKQDRIRAAQGHSFPVNIKYSEVTPPAVLFHGTQKQALASIEKSGLQHMSRQYVHLSEQNATAQTVASRRKGEVVIFQLDTAAFLAEGNKLYQAENGVWLTKHVPYKFLTLI
jgi:putative RNA 2'-phosphotransferase